MGTFTVINFHNFFFFAKIARIIHSGKMNWLTVTHLILSMDL